MISSAEKPAHVLSGGLILAVNIALFIVGIAMVVRGIQIADSDGRFSALIPFGMLFDLLGVVDVLRLLHASAE